MKVNLWDNVKRSNICVIGIPQTRKIGAKKILEETITENFPNLVTYMYRFKKLGEAQTG